MGVSRLAGLSFGLMGNLDADASIGPGYFAALIAKFARNAWWRCAGWFVPAASAVLKMQGRHFNAGIFGSRQMEGHSCHPAQPCS
jgi:hypothetical protein